MTLISLPFNPLNTQTEDITQIMSNFQAITAVVNGDLRDDNFNALATLSLTKLGQLGATDGQGVIWDSADQRWEPGNYKPTKLAQDGAVHGQTLMYDGLVDNRWEPLPYPPDIDSCKVNRTADQTAIVTGTPTLVAWDNELHDLNAMHDNVTNNSRITIKAAGRYIAIAQIGWTNAGDWNVTIEILKNGASLAPKAISQNFRDQLVGQVVLPMETLALNDFLEVRVTHTRGSNNDVESDTSWFAVFRETA